MSNFIKRIGSFLKGIDPSDFLNTYGEWHAFVEGVADGFCCREVKYKPWDKGTEDENLLKNIRKEHHYYNFGRALGFAGFIILVTGMIIWVIGALR